jgi:hypothetical protein
MLALLPPIVREEGERSQANSPGSEQANPDADYRLQKAAQERRRDKGEVLDTLVYRTKRHSVLTGDAPHQFVEECELCAGRGKSAHEPGRGDCWEPGQD